jgi:hypothetical protein
VRGLQTVGLREADLKAELTLRETQPNFVPSLITLIGLVLVPPRTCLSVSFQGNCVRQRAYAVLASDLGGAWVLGNARELSGDC